MFPSRVRDEKGGMRKQGVSALNVVLWSNVVHKHAHTLYRALLPRAALTQNRQWSESGDRAGVFSRSASNYRAAERRTSDFLNRRNVLCSWQTSVNDHLHKREGLWSGQSGFISNPRNRRMSKETKGEKERRTFRPSLVPWKWQLFYGYLWGISRE